MRGTGPYFKRYANYNRASNAIDIDIYGELQSDKYTSEILGHGLTDRLPTTHQQIPTVDRQVNHTLTQTVGRQALWGVVLQNYPLLYVYGQQVMSSLSQFKFI